jgi:hypothetical protein
MAVVVAVVLVRRPELLAQGLEASSMALEAWNLSVLESGVAALVLDWYFYSWECKRNNYQPLLPF